MSLLDDIMPQIYERTPPHLVIAPAIPPQIASWATFSSWKTIVLRSGLAVTNNQEVEGIGTNVERSVQTVPVMEAGFTLVEARRERISRCAAEDIRGPA